jgi:hypothetical protein
MMPKLDLKVSDKNEYPASDDVQGGFNDRPGKQISLIDPMAREVYQEIEQKLDSVRGTSFQGYKVGTDNPGEESGADNSNEVLTSCLGTSSCYAECYRVDKISDDIEKSGNEALNTDEIGLFRENAKDLCVSFH